MVINTTVGHSANKQLNMPGAYVPAVYVHQVSSLQYYAIMYRDLQYECTTYIADNRITA